MTTKEQAYRALYKAAEQIGERAGNDPANYSRSGRGKNARVQFNPPQILRDLIAAMGDVMRETITVDQAMGLLHTHDHDKARWGK